MDKLKLPPWWHKTEKTASKWPDKPKMVVYQQIHKCDEGAPWCIYVLEHKETVAASSLGNEDLRLFCCKDVVTQQLFEGCTVTDDIRRNLDAMKNRISQQVKLYAHVVPYPLILEKCVEAEKDVERYDDLRGEVALYKHDVTAIVEIAEQWMATQCRSFLSWIREIKNVKILDVKKETQRNDWFNEFFENFVT